MDLYTQYTPYLMLFTFVAAAAGVVALAVLVGLATERLRRPAPVEASRTADHGLAHSR